MLKHTLHTDFGTYDKFVAFADRISVFILGQYIRLSWPLAEEQLHFLVGAGRLSGFFSPLTDDCTFGLGLFAAARRYL